MVMSPYNLNDIAITLNMLKTSTAKTDDTAPVFFYMSSLIWYCTG